MIRLLIAGAVVAGLLVPAVASADGPDLIGTVTYVGEGLAPEMVAAVPTAANSTFISKREARRYAVKAVRRLANDTGWVDSYWVEHSPSCERVGSSVVECDYEVYDDDDGTGCADAVQIIGRRTTYRIRWPYEAECW